MSNTPLPTLQNICQAKALYAMCFVAHFLKRLYENRFVHIFSKTHTTLIDLAMDVAYYWGFAAVVGYGVNSGICEDLDTGRLSKFIQGCVISPCGQRRDQATLESSF